MAIHHRDAFLNTVAEKLGRPRRSANVVRPKWDYEPQHRVLKDYTSEQLVEVLRKQCDVIHTGYEHTTLKNLPTTLTTVLTAYECRSIMYPTDRRFHEYGLTVDYWRELKGRGMDVHVWNPQAGEASIRIAEQMDVGITISEMTLAESATVMLFSEGDIGRAVSLLPKYYIAIIPKSTIVPRLTQAVERLHERVKLGEQLPSCINFISGPSNSADIEMNLVVGVHGPVKATYIVVEDQ